MAAFLLSGSLEEIPLPDIARLFLATRKTGRLNLRAGRSIGAVFFDHGEIVDCQATNMSGLDALKHLALFNRGTFEFHDEIDTPSHPLTVYPTPDLIEILENRMVESRQLQELMPSEQEIPRYLGGAIPAGLEVGAADLAIALKASSGTLSVWRLAGELYLDETMVRYTLARLRAAGLVEIVGIDPEPPPRDEEPPPLPAAAPAPVATPPAAGITGALPRFWRGRKIN